MKIDTTSLNPVFNPDDRGQRSPADRVEQRLTYIFTFIHPPQVPDWPIMRKQAKEALDSLIQEILSNHQVLMYFGEKEGKEFAANLQEILNQLDSNPDPWVLGKSLSDGCAKAFEKANPGLSLIFVAHSMIYNKQVTAQNFDEAIAILGSAQKITPPLTETQMLMLEDAINGIKACKEGKGVLSQILLDIPIFGNEAFLLNEQGE